MDSVTQIALGSAVAAAGWRHSLGRGAILAGGAIATIPDLDVFIGLGDAWSGLVWHRSVTHSLIFAPLTAPIFGALAWRIAKRQGSLWAWIHMAFWALITHPILDAFTSYGTLLLWPFSRARIAWDSIAIVNLVYTIPLIAVSVYAARKKINPTHARIAAAIALALTTAYIGLGRLQHNRAIDTVENWSQEQGMQAQRVRAMPTLLNIWVWRVVWQAEGSDEVHVAHVASHRREVFYGGSWSAEQNDIRQAVLSHPRGELARWFMIDWLAFEEQEREDGLTEVRILDVRYGSLSAPTETMWGGKFIIEPDTLEILEANWERWGFKVAISRELSALAGYLTGSARGDALER